MATFIDRRLDGKNKSSVNRQRFIRRFKSQIKKAVTESMNGRSITDIDSGDKVNIPARDLSEPVFGHGPGGRREAIHPGNREFVSGDRVARPPGGGGGGSGGGPASNSPPVGATVSASSSGGSGQVSQRAMRRLSDVTAEKPPGPRQPQ